MSLSRISGLALRLRAMHFNVGLTETSYGTMQEHLVVADECMRIVREAKNLRYVRFSSSIDYFEIMEYQYETTPTAGLQRLVHFHLEDISDELVEYEPFPRSLRILHLSDWDVYSSGNRVLPLWEVVQYHNLPHLETLILENMIFKDYDPAETTGSDYSGSDSDPDSDSDGDPPSKPSPDGTSWTTLRSLTICKTKLATTFSYLVKLFPNLRSVCISHSKFLEDSVPDGKPFTIQTLTASGLQADQYVPWAISHLHCIHENPKCGPNLVFFEHHDNLVALTLRLPKLYDGLWDHIWDAAPRLLSIELECMEMDFPSMLRFMVSFIFLCQLMCRSADMDKM